MTIHYKKYISSRWFHIAIIAIVCILTYLPILRNSFAYDDIKFFKEWKTPRSFSNAMKFIEGDVPPEHEGVYRPLRTFIYAVDYKLWGDNPVGYHAQGILTNAVIAMLVYLIVAELTGRSITALVTGLLFGIHPVHTEAVTYTTASMDTIGVALGFASFYLYITSKRAGSWRSYVSFGLVIAAFFIYEVMLILPFLMLLHHVCFKKEKIHYAIPRSFLWYFGGLLYYILMRLLLLHQNPTRPVQYLGGSFFMNMVLVSKLFYLYILKIIIPINLSIFYQLAPRINTLEVQESSLKSISFINANSLITLVIIIMCAFAAIYFYRKNRLITFCILWFYIAMLPVVNFLPTHSLFAERYVYFASFGYCLLLGSAFTQRRVWAKKNTRLISVVVIVSITCWYAIATIRQNTNWKDNASLWNHVIAIAPDAPNGWNNLGTEIYASGAKEKALWYYKKALSIDPHYSNALNNLAIYYFLRGDYAKATLLFEQALQYDATNQMFYLNLIKARQKLSEQKAKHYTDADKKNIEDIISRERSLVMSGSTKQALSILEASLHKYGDEPNLLNDAGAILLSEGNYKKAIEYLKKAIAANPSDANLYLNLANAYKESGDNQRARWTAQIAIQLKPDFQQARRFLQSL